MKGRKIVLSEIRLDGTLVEKNPPDAVKIGLSDAILDRIRWACSRYEKESDAVKNRIRFVRYDVVLNRTASENKGRLSKKTSCENLRYQQPSNNPTRAVYQNQKQNWTNIIQRTKKNYEFNKRKG